MPFRRAGFNDTLVDARLAWLTGSAFPASPAGLWLSLLTGLPLSDGSGVVEATPRVAVTYGAPSTPSGDPGWSNDRSIRPTSGVTFTPTGPATPVTYAAGTAWALWSASSGGVPLYVETYAWQLQMGVPTTLPASTFIVTASEAT